METALDARIWGEKILNDKIHTSKEKSEGRAVSVANRATEEALGIRDTAKRGKKAGKLLEEGSRYGMLTFTQEAARREDRRYGLFTCDCGTVKEIGIAAVKSGRTISCGCFSAKSRKIGFFLANAKYSFIKNKRNPANNGAMVIPREHPNGAAKNEKTCCDCGDIKPLKEFRRLPNYYSNAPSGYYKRCKDCIQAKAEKRKAREEKRKADRLERIAMKEQLPKAPKVVKVPAPAKKAAAPPVPWHPITLTLTIHSPEEAMRLHQMGYISMDTLQAAGVLLPERNSDTYNELQRKAIHKAITDEFGYDLDDLKQKCRKRELVFPRQLSMYLLEKFTNMNQRAIASMYGKRDHTAVIHARNTIIDHLTFRGDSYEKTTITDFLNKYNFEY